MSPPRRPFGKLSRTTYGLSSADVSWFFTALRLLEVSTKETTQKCHAEKSRITLTQTIFNTCHDLVNGMNDFGRRNVPIYKSDRKKFFLRNLAILVAEK